MCCIRGAIGLYLMCIQILLRIWCAFCWVCVSLCMRMREQYDLFSGWHWFGGCNPAGQRTGRCTITYWCKHTNDDALGTRYNTPSLQSIDNRYSCNWKKSDFLKLIPRIKMFNYNWCIVWMNVHFYDKETLKTNTNLKTQFDPLENGTVLYTKNNYFSTNKQQECNCWVKGIWKQYFAYRCGNEKIIITRYFPSIKGD